MLRNKRSGGCTSSSNGGGGGGGEGRRSKFQDNKGGGGMSHDGERGEGDWTGVVSDRHGHTLFWQVLKLIFSKILIHSLIDILHALLLI